MGIILKKMTLYDSMMYTDGYKIKEPTRIVGSFIFVIQNDKTDILA